jgi:hypothetical protein
MFMGPLLFSPFLHRVQGANFRRNRIPSVGAMGYGGFFIAGEGAERSEICERSALQLQRDATQCQEQPSLPR